jgi:hypothetical protein
MMTINDYSFFLKNLKKRNQITISSVTTVWKDHNWRLNEMLQCFWYGVSKKSFISMFSPQKLNRFFVQCTDCVALTNTLPSIETIWKLKFWQQQN